MSNAVSDSYSEYVNAVNSCLSQARTGGLTETYGVITSIASNTTRPSSKYGQASSNNYGTSVDIWVAYAAPTSYKVGQIWLDCSALLVGETPIFKVSLDVSPALTPALIRWWPLDSLPLVYSPYLAIQQGLAAVGPSSQGTFKRELLTVPLDGQTAFSISSVPTNAAYLSMEVNGVAYNTPAAFTMAGIVLTWLNPFTLKTTDSVYAVYS